MNVNVRVLPLMPALVASVSVSVLVSMTVAGCSPSLDWREVRPPGSGALAHLPCRPVQHVRNIMVAQTALTWSMASCSAADMTWAVAFADVKDPARVAAVLIALQALAKDNVAAGSAQPVPSAVPGATPNPQSGRWTLLGRLPDGRPVAQQLALFVKGTVVYQATVLGSPQTQVAAEPFFAALSLASGS